MRFIRATEVERGPWVSMEGDRPVVCPHGVDLRYFMRSWTEDGMNCSEMKNVWCRKCSIVTAADAAAIINCAELVTEKTE